MDQYRRLLSDGADVNAAAFATSSVRIFGAAMCNVGDGARIARGVPARITLSTIYSLSSSAPYANSEYSDGGRAGVVWGGSGGGGVVAV
jgi:hypothetical protein